MIDLLKGNARLWIAFWVVPIMFLIIHYACLLVLLASNNERIIQQAVPYLGALVYLYLAYIWASIWRCAKNTSWVGWANLAKLVVIISILQVILMNLLVFNIISESNFIILRNFFTWFVVFASTATSFYLIFFVVRKQLVHEKMKEQDSDLLTKAKLAYKARNYSEALKLFEAAHEESDLNELALTYMELCKKRVETT